MLKLGIRKIVNSIKKIVGEDNYSRYQLLKIQYNHQKALSRIKNKEIINVCFFLIHESVWKYEELYQLLKKDKRFNPIVLVCPYVMYGEENMLNDMEKAYNAFKENGYNVIKALKDDSTWIDVKKELKPDLIFFTNPHNLTKPQYYIHNFKDCLTCYVPYNFGTSYMIKLFHGELFYNLVWKIFAETDIHKDYSRQVALNKGRNVIVTGFPGTDKLLDFNYNSDYAINWKHRNTKKIIWAPHHTIDDDKNFISFSSFLIYHQYMFDLLKQFDEQIEIVFKPHPLLKVKLYEHQDWGKEKTDSYYNAWRNHLFGGLNEGNYIDLFKTSDAMIHDSGSFLIEYLYTEKPVLRTDRDDTICNRLNSFGKLAYQVHYIATNQLEIELFIENIVLKGKKDIKEESRKEFKQKYLIPQNGMISSINIYNFIKKSIS